MSTSQPGDFGERPAQPQRRPQPAHVGATAVQTPAAAPPRSGVDLLAIARRKLQERFMAAAEREEPPGGLLLQTDQRHAARNLADSLLGAPGLCGAVDVLLCLPAEDREPLTRLIIAWRKLSHEAKAAALAAIPP